MGSFLPKSVDYLFGIGGGSALTVKDEGIVLGASIKSIDFIGSGVVASLTGPNQVTVGIGSTPPSFSISNFTNNRNILEKGQSIGPTGTYLDILFNWSYSSGSPDTSQSINNGVGSITPLSATSKLFSPSSNITSDITYTLTAVNNSLSYIANTSIVFRSKRYWGVSANNDPIIAGVTNYSTLTLFLDAINEECATTRQTTKTFDCTGGRYFYFFFPTAWGTTSPQVQVGPFPIVLSYVQTITNFENASGHQEDYYVYRSDNLLNSNAVVVQVL